ncbi:MAG: hypothetical protein ACRCUJ_08460 [Phocaeicola sp.]
MKKTKLAVFVAALFSIFTLSSCLNGSSGTMYDIYEVVTVESYMGTPYLRGDGTGYTYNPLNNSILSGLMQKDGEYYKRAQIGIKLAEGEVFSDTKKSYKISEIAIYDYVPYKNMTARPDTLKDEKYALVDLEAGSSKIWAVNRYVNVPFTFKTVNQLTANDFELFAYEAKVDTLFLRFHQKTGSETAYSTGTGLISFYMPYEPQFTDLYNQALMQSTSELRDSIYIAVTALGESNKELKKVVRYKAN